MNEITIAVVSDLHCHHSRKFNKTDNPTSFSYLTTDLVRIPSKTHPVQSLADLFKTETNIKADYLLCPGDITNQVDIQGFITGWEYVREIAQMLNVRESNLIATLGNHDVDSRYNICDDDVFKIAQSISRNFPMEDDALAKAFWTDGYCFIERESIRILVINSVKFHTSKDTAVKGKMDEKQIAGIESYLMNHKDDKMQIALCHHHPIEHARFKLGTNDTIELGGELINVLNKSQFDLLIHGHKHDPWLRYSHGNNGSLPIFSAGSFSATTNLMLTSAKNTFHIIKLRKNPNKKALGNIMTWEYLPNYGWRRADSGDHFFPANTGFGYNGNINELVEKSVQIIEGGNGSFINWNDFKQQLGEVAYLTPDESVEFRTKLSEKGVITNPELPKEPKIIGKPHF